MTISTREPRVKDGVIAERVRVGHLLRPYDIKMEEAKAEGISIVRFAMESQRFPRKGYVVVIRSDKEITSIFAGNQFKAAMGMPNPYVLLPIQYISNGKDVFRTIEIKDMFDNHVGMGYGKILNHSGLKPLQRLSAAVLLSKDHFERQREVSFLHRETVSDLVSFWPAARAFLRKVEAIVDNALEVTETEKPDRFIQRLLHTA